MPPATQRGLIISWYHDDENYDRGRGRDGKEKEPFQSAKVET